MSDKPKRGLTTHCAPNTSHIVDMHNNLIVQARMSFSVSSLLAYKSRYLYIAFNREKIIVYLGSYVPRQFAFPTVVYEVEIEQ